MNLKKIFFLCISLSFTITKARTAETVTANDILNLQTAKIEHFNKDGSILLYGIFTPRGPNEKPGPSKLNYYLHHLKENSVIPLMHDSFSISSPRISPAGDHIAFLYKKGKEHQQVWVLPANGGSIKPMTNSPGTVSAFQWLPDGSGIAYIAAEPETEREKELKKRGYGFIFYEENLKNNHLFLAKINEGLEVMSTNQLTQDMNIWDFNLGSEGNKIAFTASEENLIDQKYMFRKIYVMDINTGTKQEVIKNRGKLGPYALSPDGNKLAFTSAYNMQDHAVSQALVLNLENNELRNLTPEGYIGHMTWIEWIAKDEVSIYAEEKVYPKLIKVNLKNDKTETILDSEDTGITFGQPVFTEGFEKIAFVGSSPYDPYQVFVKDKNAFPEQITDINRHIKNKTFGKQEVFQYTSRDGANIEGILMYPANYQAGVNYPLIMYIHGGPEAHYSNGWLSHYSTPGQVMAGKGYMVAYVNYRASTGYGVDFGMVGYGDPAGKEFDDIADGITYLVENKGADKERVGVAGGSYGGYASAWFATYYTDYVKAACMFVGVSNLISKKGTTDIPYEDMLVHSGKPLEEQWQFNLERSPVYYARQSKTATLIYSGADDTRVHPSQSLELYRRMKMNNHPAVRLVFYPGEGHGNRKQVGRMDVLYRQMNWFDWYLQENKPIDGPMPALDISSQYGLDWDFE